MGQETNYKRTLHGSIGAGMKSIMGEKGKRYFILEHKVSSKFHKAGENQKIIIDQIEIGRDPKSQVRFDESFTTVSRRHAAIIKDGDNWKIIPLSQTNSTYLNGHKIDKEWYLQNGDEIQLSTNGPKLGFITPSGDKGFVKSIGMTARLNLFRKQALLPYKKAISALTILVLIGLIVAGLIIYFQANKLSTQEQMIAELNDYTKQIEENAQDQIAQVNLEKDALVKKIDDIQSKIGKGRGRTPNASSQHQTKIQIPPSTKIGNKQTGINKEALASILPCVYFIYTTSIEITMPDGESGVFECGTDGTPGWFGSGFLLDDGKFVTARHVIEAWNYWISGDKIDESMLELNAIINNGGKIKVNFGAISSNGNQIKFSSDQFKVSHSHDKVERLEDGTKLSYAVANNTDYAYMNIGKGHGLKYNKIKSTSMNRGDELILLGFPNGFGVHPTSVNPISSSVKVGIDGLENGIILTSETNMDHGNSGGPALILDENGDYIVVGIASAISGKNLGMIVPISVI